MVVAGQELDELSSAIKVSICQLADQPSATSSAPFRPRRVALLDALLMLVPCVPFAAVPVLMKSYETLATPYSLTLAVSANAGREASREVVIR